MQRVCRERVIFCREMKKANLFFGDIFEKKTIAMKLKNILLLNAISSGMTGLLLAAVPHVFADIFQLANLTPFTAVGVFLVLFALFVAVTALVAPLRIGWVRVIIALDTIWVVLSIICAAALFTMISLWGSLVILGIAVWVGAMAYLQNRALISV